ncbi:MAG: carnitine dehydratase [Sulfobacillus thermosulfidooxidans]|uniref:Carnitine dehydratase n=1 Tax=Sulfobacillus thermotolerans TaxID=338644 RepID=A0ABN5H486_9FIRM|nr:carnitine dehydratase [Sulfobacillus thermotolerans]MCY0907556.1 CoA transferase [Sulfobacillus thermotolerans]PSR37527.1 MAG: carnitine dehydratase [Sulfobacillus thermosulfidooxidans]
MTEQKTALQGLRVLEIGSLVAASSATRIMGDFGAEVIKIEPPSGDNLRAWGAVSPTGSSWWWQMQSRNKQLVSVDLKKPEGQAIVRDLARWADVVVANLRPATLRNWGLDYSRLKENHPSLVYVQITGHGLTGPYQDRPGFGNIAEAMGGIRYVTGYPDRPPVRTGVSLGDELAALYGVIGALTALRHRDNTGEGQLVDVALTESVLSLTEAMMPEYLNEGIIQERSGNQLLRAAPSGTYPTADGSWVAIGANTEGTFAALASAMNRVDLLSDPRFADNPQRVKHADVLDEVITKWTSSLTATLVLEKLTTAQVPAGLVMSAKDIAQDPQFLARDMMVRVPADQGEFVGMLGVVPRLSATPGRILLAGGAVGRDSSDVLQRVLGRSLIDIDRLKAEGVIR